MRGVLIALGLSTSSVAHAQMTSMPPGAPTEAAPFGSPVDDQRVYIHAALEQLDSRVTGDGADLRWMGEGWIGTDSNRLWIKSEGQLDRHGQVSDGQLELLYDRPISPYFDVQAGARFDLDSRPGRGWAALGVEGLAPYRIYVAATGYLGDGGRAAAKLEASYDLLLTQRLILSPQGEVNLYSRADPIRHIGAGVSQLDAGLRLRYEITRKFAPYIGVAIERA
ncbi:MAG TPA: copper resistance protein B, partial [Caulobacteraceae bacterium]